MKTQSLVSILIALNLALLFFLVASNSWTTAQTDAEVLRGRSLELVGDRGQVRAQINVEEYGQVVLRLRDETGAVRVKLGADESGSGFILMDETTSAAVQMIARQAGIPNSPTTTGIILRGANNQENVITPSRPLSNVA